MVAKDTAAKLAEAVVGYDDKDRATKTDVANPNHDGGKYIKANGDWIELLQMFESGEVDPTIMLTHRLRFEEIAKGYYMQEKR
ncbi:S-(Hydroxymethyl)glutathione dehydrogenase [Pyrenophora tritici-repentis]|nr:S-(Hydroxymethyl)glutathione dehydrogenase [Pyrenophora tritici-repentis]